MFSFHLRPRYFIYDSIETFDLNSTDGKGEEDNLDKVELFKLNQEIFTVPLHQNNSHLEVNP